MISDLTLGEILDEVGVLCFCVISVGKRSTVRLNVVPVVLFFRILIGTHPTPEGITHTLRLGNMENSLVLGVNRLNAVAARTEVKVYLIEVSVVINPEYCRTIGSDSVGLVEKVSEALEAGQGFCFELGGVGARVAVAVGINRIEVVNPRIEVVVDILLIVHYAEMRKTCYIEYIYRYVAVNTIGAVRESLIQRTARRKRHRGITLDLRVSHGKIDRIARGIRRYIRVVRRAFACRRIGDRGSEITRLAAVVGDLLGFISVSVAENKLIVL